MMNIVRILYMRMCVCILCSLLKYTLLVQCNDMEVTRIVCLLSTESAVVSNGMCHTLIASHYSQRRPTPG